MLLTKRQLLPFSPANCLFPSLSPFPFSHSINFTSRPTNQYSLCSARRTWIAQISEEPTTTASTAVSSAEPPPEEGPVELPPSVPPIFATSDEPTALQTATSVLLTGAITVFLFRSLRRRAKRAKETVFCCSSLRFCLSPSMMFNYVAFELVMMELSLVLCAGYN